MIDFNNPDLHDQTTRHKTFQDLPLEPFYVSSLKTIGFNTPTPVQYYSINHTQKQNLILQSKSGTGKTLAFTSICLNTIFKQGLPAHKDPTILIMEPTRQLAVQVYQNIRKILASGKNQNASNPRERQVKSLMNKISIHLSIGGLPIQDDRKRYIQSGCHISVGTIGRIYELVQNKILKLQKVRTLVLDEGDKLFEQNDSINKMKFITSKIVDAQILVYSATFSNTAIQQIKKLGQFKFIRTMASEQQMKVKEVQNINLAQDDYEGVQMDLKNITKLTLKMVANEKSIFTQKLTLIKQIFSTLSFNKCLIFVEKKAQIPQIFQSLKSINPLLIHGSLTQSSRIKLMNQLNSHKVIITSDLLARGIDIVVDLIILFNANEGDNFWHRVGRTGRIGRRGVVLSLDYIQGWEEYSALKANQALSECLYVPQKEVFGSYMTEMGNWMDVDAEMEMSNINNYRYFDQQEFKREMGAEMQVQMDENELMCCSDQVVLNQQLVEDVCGCEDVDLVFKSGCQLSQYIRSVLRCQNCVRNLGEISALTGYRFQILGSIDPFQNI